MKSINKRIIIQLLSCFIPSKKLRHRFRDKFTSSIIENCGSNNKLIILDDNGNESSAQHIEGLRVHFRGSNSIVKIYKSTLLPKGLEIFCGNNAYFESKRTKYCLIFDSAVMLTGSNSRVVIGENCSFGGIAIRMHDASDVEVNIGNDCMFSFDITLYPTDAHIIYNSKTKKILNKPESILIGNSCWIGKGVSILKGANIPSHTILGLGSLWTKGSNINPANFENDEGIVFAGIPAKLIKTGLSWARETSYPDDYYIKCGE